MALELNTAQRATMLTGRALLGLYFIIPGITKITGWSQTVDSMSAHGVPLIPLALGATIIIQIGGGVALIAGFQRQIVAFALALLTLVISIYMHDFWNITDDSLAHETQNFVKNMAIMAGLLYVAGSHDGPIAKH